MLPLRLVQAVRYTESFASSGWNWSLLLCRLTSVCHAEGWHNPILQYVSCVLSVQTTEACTSHHRSMAGWKEQCGFNKVDVPFCHCGWGHKSAKATVFFGPWSGGMELGAWKSLLSDAECPQLSQWDAASWQHSNTPHTVEQFNHSFKTCVLGTANDGGL